MVSFSLELRERKLDGARSAHDTVVAVAEKARCPGFSGGAEEDYFSGTL